MKLYDCTTAPSPRRVQASVLRDQQIGAMPRLRWTCVNLTSPRDALTRGQIGMVLDGTDQEIERLL